MHLNKNMANVLHEMRCIFCYSTAIQQGSGGFVPTKLKNKLPIKLGYKCNIKTIYIRDHFKVEGASFTDVKRQKVLFKRLWKPMVTG